MTRRLHRLLFSAALGLALGAGLWLEPAIATHAADPSSTSDVPAIAAIPAAHASVASVRLRTPVPGTLAGTAVGPRRAHARPARGPVTGAEHHGSTKLHVLLRVHRV